MGAVTLGVIVYVGLIWNYDEILSGCRFLSVSEFQHVLLFMIYAAEKTYSISLR